MRITMEEVRHVALLARVGMTDQEAELMRDQLSHILEQFEVLRQVDTEEIEPTGHSADLESVMRDDEVSPSRPLEDVLAVGREAPDRFVMGYMPIVGGFPTGGYVNPMMMGAPGPVTAVPYWDSPPASPGNDKVQAMLRHLGERTGAAGGGLPQAPRVGPAARRPALAKGPQHRAAGDLDLVGKARSSAAADGDRAAQRLAASRSSSAGRAVLSVAEARRLHQKEQEAVQKEAASLLERGRAAEKSCKVALAKSLYKSAAKRATGTLLQQIQARLAALAPPQPR